MTQAIIFDIGIMLFETFELVLLADHTFKRRIEPWKTVLLIAGCHLLRRLMLGDGHIFLPLVISMDILLLICCFSGNIISNIVLVFIFYAFSTIADVIAILVLTTFYDLEVVAATNREIMYEQAVILSKLLLLVGVGLWVMLGRNRSQESISDWFLYLPAPILTVCILLIESPFNRDITDSENARMMVFLCLAIFAANLFMMLAIKRSSEKDRLENRLKLLKVSNQLGFEYYEELKRAYENIRKTAHDFKLHLAYLEACDNLDKTKEYLAKIRGNMASLDIVRYTGNYDIDTIINALHQEMAQKDIRLNLNQVLPPDINWLEPTDMSILLGNALQNAINACEECQEKYINLSFKLDEQKFIINTENPTKEKISLKSPVRSIFDEHGIGMENMKTITEQYEGILNHEIKDGIFKLTVLLQKPEQPEMKFN